MARALLSLLIITTLNMAHAKAEIDKTQIDSAAFFWAGLTQQITHNIIVINDRRFKLEKIQSVTLKNSRIISSKNIQEGMVFGMTMDMANEKLLLWEIEANQIPDYLR